MMKILHLTLKKQWFDMILSGEKKEEYREVKPYWGRRLTREYELGGHESLKGVFKKYDIIRFTNGYSKGAPTFDIEYKGITIDYGMTSWGAPQGQQVFIISLGKIL